MCVSFVLHNIRLLSLSSLVGVQLIRMWLLLQLLLLLLVLLFAIFIRVIPGHAFLRKSFLFLLSRYSYQDILKIPTSLSQFSTSLGPIVDGHVIPNQPYKVMGQYTEHFSRYVWVWICYQYLVYFYRILYNFFSLGPSVRLSYKLIFLFLLLFALRL